MASTKDERPKPIEEEVRRHIARWQDFRGMTPFASFDSPHGVDRANFILSGANCLLSVLAAAFEDSGALVGKGQSSEIDSRSGTMMAGALEGIATLIDLAAFVQE